MVCYYIKLLQDGKNSRWVPLAKTDLNVGDGAQCINFRCRTSRENPDDVAIKFFDTNCGEIVTEKTIPPVYINREWWEELIEAKITDISYEEFISSGINVLTITAAFLTGLLKLNSKDGSVQYGETEEDSAFKRNRSL